MLGGGGEVADAHGGRAAVAVVEGGQQRAVDPPLLRGALLGTRRIAGEDVPFVASPMHKQAFDLRTGRCLDDPDNPEVVVATYDARVVDGFVEVALRPS